MREGAGRGCPPWLTLARQCRPPGKMPFPKQPVPAPCDLAFHGRAPHGFRALTRTRTSNQGSRRHGVLPKPTSASSISTSSSEPGAPSPPSPSMASSGPSPPAPSLSVSHSLSPSSSLHCDSVCGQQHKQSRAQTHDDEQHVTQVLAESAGDRTGTGLV